jgi:hypothetical protein
METLSVGLYRLPGKKRMCMYSPVSDSWVTGEAYGLIRIMAIPKPLPAYYSTDCVHVHERRDGLFAVAQDYIEKPIAEIDAGEIFKLRIQHRAALNGELSLAALVRAGTEVPTHREPVVVDERGTVRFMPDQWRPLEPEEIELITKGISL